MELVIVVLAWVLLAFAVGSFWKSRGQSYGTGVVWSLILSPLIGFLLGLALGPDTQKQEENRLESGEQRKCPFCAEIIKREALVCRFCGRDLPPAPPPPPAWTYGEKTGS